MCVLFTQYKHYYETVVYESISKYMYTHSRQKIGESHTNSAQSIQQHAK